jgi:murein DD-endopeptidase MepM/ murein hydrolase activator NlpD
MRLAHPDRRPHILASIIVATILVWLLFGQTQPSVVMSDWNGDPIMAQKVAAAEQSTEQTVGLSAQFNKQVEVTTTLTTATNPEDVPWGNPTNSAHAVMTQGYGVGTHAPAEIWGGIDLAIDGDGDGRDDPEASWNAPLYATMSGIIELQPNSMPAGNHAWIKNKRYKVGYAHLQSFAVKDGQTVKRGDLIGYMGATGYATGPHLHYHIWEDGINVNPLNYGALPY